MIYRVLTIGNKIENIDGFEDVKFSNYTINHSSESIWQKKISAIENYINSGELKLIMVVVSKKFVEDIETVSNTKLINFFNLCKKTKCIILVQNYWLEDKPLLKDIITNKKYDLDELEEVVRQIEIDIEKNHDTKLLKIIKEHYYENSKSFYSDIELLDEYKRKLQLLNKTKMAFPRAKKIIKLLNTEFSDVVDFEYLSETLNIAEYELSDVFSTEILNIYIPKKYVYINEVEDFIHIFEKYLKNIEKLDFIVEKNETRIGINFKFISKEKLDNIKDFQNIYNRFSSFIDLCEQQRDTALKLLEEKNIDSKAAIDIIEYILKKYKRLLIDIEQQQERIELACKQELQNKIFELSCCDKPNNLIGNSVSLKNIEDIYINNDQDKEILKLIQMYGENIHEINIKSDLGKINDSEIESLDRRKSAHKIKKVLIRIAKSAEKVGVEYLIRDIISKI